MEQKRGHAGGRPSVISKEKVESLYKYLKIGSYPETAAAAAGISKTTFYKWLKYGRRVIENNEKRYKKIVEKDRMYVEFVNAYDEAIAIAEMRDLIVIDKAAQEDWRAAAWRQERRNPKRWGLRQQQEIEATIKEVQPFKNEKDFLETIREVVDVAKEFSENGDVCEHAGEDG